MVVTTTSVRLPDDLSRLLDELAARTGTSRSEIIREAVESYCRDLAQSRPGNRVELLDRLVTYRGSGRGDLAARSKQHLREMFGARRRRRSR